MRGGVCPRVGLLLITGVAIALSAAYSLAVLTAWWTAAR
jgi:hypothetical protein